MSFLENLSPEQKANFQTVNDWEAFLELEWKRHIEYEGGNISHTSFTIANKIFDDRVFLAGKYQCSIEFKACYFLSVVLASDLSVDNELTIEGCYFEQGMAFYGKQTLIGGTLNIIDSALAGKFWIFEGRFQLVKLNFKDNSDILISGGAYRELIIGERYGAKINNLELDLNSITGQITITNPNTEINTLILRNSSNEIAIILEDFFVNQIFINKFRNANGLKVLNVTPFNKPDGASVFEIADSYLGKAEFYSIDFNEFQEVRITDTYLAECGFVNVNWPKQIDPFVRQKEYMKMRDQIFLHKMAGLTFANKREKWKMEKDKDVLQMYANQREIFRQLKYAYSRQGDIINEQRFHELELLAYNKSLTWTNNWPTKIVIGLSYRYGRFGQDIRSPVFGLFCIHFVLFWIMLLSGGLAPLHFALTGPTWNGAFTGLNRYFYLMNPLRRFDEDTFRGALILIDLLMRIWSSYMIYNFIRASRRFIK
jgi:hypothetical protein